MTVMMWSVVVRRDDDPVGNAVPFEGEQEFIDYSLAWDVWDAVVRQFRFSAISPRKLTEYDRSRGVQQVITGLVGTERFVTHIELQCEQLPPRTVE